MARLIGDWFQESVLGAGKFGIVVLWSHKYTDTKLVLKTYRNNEGEQTEKDLWIKEVEFMKHANHENIISTVDIPAQLTINFYNTLELPMLCMEYCQGGNLRKQLNKLDSSCGLHEHQVRDILKDIKNGLEYLHSNGVIHRNLNPDNVVKQIFNEQIVYKIIDLGFYKTDFNDFVSIKYLSPEFLSKECCAYASDYWSFGIFAFEIITGQIPFLPYSSPSTKVFEQLKKKTHEEISMFETFHGDFEFSRELFKENHLSKIFKKYMEIWLKIALEFDAKKRGLLKNNESSYGSDVIIFKCLDDILSKKILSVFSASTMSKHSYEIHQNTTIKDIKLKICDEAQISIDEQLIITTNLLEPYETDFVLKYFQRSNQITFFLYNKLLFLENKINLRIPLPIQRCLQNPKTLYNFNNSQNLYRSCSFLLSEQVNTLQLFIESCSLKIEYLKNHGKDLLLKMDAIDQNMNKIEIMEEILTKLFKISKKKILEKADGRVPYERIHEFETTLKEIDMFYDDLNKMKRAWEQLTARILSVNRRCNELNIDEFTKESSSYDSIKKDFDRVYLVFKEKCEEYKKKDKPCLSIVKISHTCVKTFESILQNLRQSTFFVFANDITIEIDKIKLTLKTAEENSKKIKEGIQESYEKLMNGVWNIVGVTSDYTELPYAVVAYGKPNGKIKILEKDTDREDNDILKSLIEENKKLHEQHEKIKNEWLTQYKQDNAKEFKFDFHKN